MQGILGDPGAAKRLTKIRAGLLRDLYVLARMIHASVSLHRPQSRRVARGHLALGSPKRVGSS